LNAHAQPVGTWIECSFDVEGQRIGVSVKRLDEDERQRMAAEIAWYAAGLLTPGVELWSTTSWPALLDRILSHYVAITVAEDRSGDAVDFWNQVICRSFGAFARTNRLFSDLAKHLGAGFAPQ
jgi:hypothetical protein